MKRFKFGKNINLKINILTILVYLTFILPVSGQNHSTTAGIKYTPPPEPEIQPLVSFPMESDTDRSKIDDQIEITLTQIKTQLADPNISSSERIKLENSLNEKIFAVIPLLGTVFIFMKIFPRLAGAARLTMAFLVGAGAAVILAGAPTMNPYAPQASKGIVKVPPKEPLKETKAFAGLP